MPTAAVGGTVEPGFEEVRDELARLVATDPDYSAQFCAYVGGRPVVDLHGGVDQPADSIQGVFSATKGAAAVCIALLVERGHLDLDAPVDHYWPEFAQAGKGGLAVRTVLSHQAGLIGVDPQVTVEELLDHDHYAARLAAQAPFWRPGAAQGYHALSIGAIMDELVRRIDGRTIATFFEAEIAEPRGIEFFIAVPESAEPRIVDVLPVQQPDLQPESAAGPMGQEPDSLAGVAFNLAVSDPFDPPLANLRQVRAAGMSAVGGAGSARGLARLYASCISDVDGLPRLLSEETVAAVSGIQAAGPDLVLGMPTRFGIVFQAADDRLAYGSHRSFGHDGAGGAIGVADPAHDLAFGYIPRRMSVPGGADAHGLGLARTARRCLARQVVR